MQGQAGMFISIKQIWKGLWIDKRLYNLSLKG